MMAIIGVSGLLDALIVAVVLWTLSVLLSIALLPVQHLFLRGLIFLVSVRLPQAGRDHVASWIGSWEYELEQDMKRRGTSTPARRTALLRRAWSLVMYVPTLRKTASEAARRPKNVKIYAPTGRATARAVAPIVRTRSPVELGGEEDRRGEKGRAQKP